MLLITIRSVTKHADRNNVISDTNNDNVLSDGDQNLDELFRKTVGAVTDQSDAVNKTNLIKMQRDDKTWKPSCSLDQIQRRGTKFEVTDINTHTYSDLDKDTHTQTHTHTHTHTYTHTHTHTHTHRHTRVHTHTCTYIYTYTYTHMTRTRRQDRFLIGHPCSLF